MATTSIWRVKGWLGKVVIYVENPEKTDNPTFVNQPDMTDQQSQALSDVIDYAVNSDKTQGLADEHAQTLKSFVSGINCNPQMARDEMIAVKKRFRKEDGTIAYHGYQSFAPGEATPEIAHEIGVKLAERLWGDRYQVLVATHLDKESHLHNHFLLNTVSFVDGIKFHRTEQDYHDMREMSDALCREYGLSVIADPQQGQSKNYGEWRAEQEGRPTWRGLVRADVDEAIRQSMTERQFFDALRKKGYAFKLGKDISVRPPGKERYVRLKRNFGDDYSIEGIRHRILQQTKPEQPLPEPPPQRKPQAPKGTFHPTRKATGFRALYFHYCYLLGIFPKDKPPSNKRLHFLLREDLIKLDAITKEAQLLEKHQIDTAEQLTEYRGGLEERATAVAAARKELYKKQRRVEVRTDSAKAAEVKAEISALSKELNALRKEVVLCDDIAQRSGVMLEKLEAVQEDENRRKETSQDEQLRRRGRASREIES